ncbi:hypothetical protein CC2G_006512 [Coprinopsis cinerea AmutBmut pab1-1]|nr:hypothetical protein CC2G_006512 [Coprinopsis cinerea AmutBmut pab1-1]
MSAQQLPTGQSPEPLPLKFVLSTSTPWNTNYCTEDGQVIYKVESNFTLKLFHRSSTIYKIIPNEDESMKDQFTQIAHIDFRVMKPSIITLGDEVSTVDEIFRKGKINWSRVARDRVCTGPDGREYRWVLGDSKPELYLNDKSKTLIAKYHLKHYGIIKDARPASLEIYDSRFEFPPESQLPPPDEGERTRKSARMVDWIVTTFVYIAKLREDRDSAQTTAAIG